METVAKFGHLKGITCYHIKSGLHIEKTGRHVIVKQQQGHYTV